MKIAVWQHGVSGYSIIYCLAWPRPKPNTKIAFNNHHHPPQTFWKVPCSYMGTFGMKASVRLRNWSKIYSTPNTIFKPIPCFSKIAIDFLFLWCACWQPVYFLYTYHFLEMHRQTQNSFVHVKKWLFRGKFLYVVPCFRYWGEVHNSTILCNKISLVYCPQQFWRALTMDW